MIRREHKKSRNGCSRCRARRVKCDEQVPCKNCVRRKENCDLLLPAALRSRQKACLTCGQRVIKDVNRDIFLMHHYTLHTSQTIVFKGKKHAAFQEWIPEHSTTYDYLLSGLLALAAAHLAYLKPGESSTWLPMALRHQACAIESFKSAISQGPSRDDADALYGQSILSAVMSLANLTISPEEDSRAIDHIIDFFLIFRGAGELASATMDWLKRGPFRESIHGHYLDTQANLSRAASSRIKDLQNMITSTSTSRTSETALLSAVDALQFIYRELASDTRLLFKNNLGFVSKWCNLVSPEYVDLLQNRNPAALVVFCDFAILLKYYADDWYIHGWAEKAVRCIAGQFGDEWAAWVKWPEDQLRDNLGALRVYEMLPAIKTITDGMMTKQEMVSL